MRVWWSARPRPIWVAVFVFLVVGVVGCGVAGVWLARNPAASLPGYVSAYRLSATGRTLLRTPRGVELGDYGGTTESGERGEVLGSVSYVVAVGLTGWPRTYRQNRSLTVDHIEPAGGGPPAADERAWRALVIEALRLEGRPAQNEEIPARLAGETGVVEVWRPGAFVMNAGRCLWETPRCLGACLAARRFAPQRRGRGRREEGGRCVRCGYDLAGLSGGVCPVWGGGVNAFCVVVVAQAFGALATS
jgi:hypothetical protein